MKKYWPNFIIITLIGSCYPIDDAVSNRVLLAKSEVDQSSIWDSNDDDIEDVERWYRGSSIVYEKVDVDFDGYWDYQGRRHHDGSFTILVRYPVKKLSVKDHHIFLPSEDYPQSVLIRARR